MSCVTLFRDHTMDLRLCWYAPGSRMAPHAHAAHQVSWLLAGGLCEQGGNRVREMSGPSVGVKGAGFRHANTYGPHGALILSLNVDPDCEAPGAVRALDDWRWSPCAGDGAGARALARSVYRGGSGAGRRTGAVSRDAATDGGLVAARAAARDAAWDLLALATERRPAEPPAAARAVPRWLHRVRERLECPDEPSDIAALARDEGVHRVYLSRRFREVFGISPSLYRRGCRLARAVASLACGDAAVNAAQEAGFADQAHLGRVARRELGLTPGQLRYLLTD